MEQKEIDAKLKEFQSQIDGIKKDYELKLDSEKKNAEEWKTTAESKQAELKKFQEAAEKDKKASEAKLAEARKAESKQFVEARKSEGKLIPAQDRVVLALMDSMSSDGEVLKFEEGGKTVSHSQLSLFKDFLNSLGKRIIYGTQSRTGETQVAGLPAGMREDETESFQEVIIGGMRKTVQVDEADLASKASEYQAEQAKAGKRVDYGEALVAVQKQQRRI